MRGLAGVTLAAFLLVGTTGCLDDGGDKSGSSAPRTVSTLNDVPEQVRPTLAKTSLVDTVADCPTRDP
jgi:hypothetical protein